MGRAWAWPVCVVAALSAAGGAAAHPHVFVDAGAEFRLDPEGRLVAVRIVWVYDDFTSMLVLGDLGLDPGPGDRLDDAGLARLSGFDMRWDAGFAGDTHLRAGEAAVALGPPADWTADYVQGRIVTSHVRALPAPLDPRAAPVVMQLYDPTYYTAYTIAAPPQVTGAAGCRAEIWGADLGAASAMLEAALRELAGGYTEEEFPAIGAAFADEIRLTCDAPS